MPSCNFFKLVHSRVNNNNVGISSNLIGSLSTTHGQCPPPGRWIMKQWPAGVNSRFAEVIENNILRM